MFGPSHALVRLLAASAILALAAARSANTTADFTTIDRLNAHHAVQHQLTKDARALGVRKPDVSRINSLGRRRRRQGNGRRAEGAEPVRGVSE